MRFTPSPFQQRWIPTDARVAAGKMVRCDVPFRTIKGMRSGTGLDRFTTANSTNAIGDGSGNGVLSPGDGSGGVGGITFQGYITSGNASHTLKFNSGSTYVVDVNGTTTNAYDIVKVFGTGTGTGNVQVVSGAKLTVNLWTPATNTVLDATVIDGTGAKLDAGNFAVTWNQTGGWSGLATTWDGADLHVTGTYSADGGGDSNSNAIPDVWEWQSFGNLTNEVSDDADGDGLSNYGEWVAGTHPTNRQSLLAFTNMLQNSEGGTVVRWPSESNRYYTLRLSTNLVSDPFSTALTNRAPATPPMNVHTDSVLRAGGAYYRIEVER
jgi:hypothetical protein